MLCNRPRALAYMRRYGLDALVATSPVNVTYFTDYYWWGDHLFKPYMFSPAVMEARPATFALFPAEGEAALIVSNSTAINAADSWVKSLYLYGDDGFDWALSSPPGQEETQSFLALLYDVRHYRTAVDALQCAMHQRGLADARIGLDMGQLSAAAEAEIRQALPQATIKDATNLIRLIRMVKSEEELRRIRRAGEISEQALQTTLQGAYVGQSAQALVQQYRASIAELGAGADFDHFIYSVRGQGMAAEPASFLDEDDVLFVDAGCVYQHYFSDTGLTFAFKRLPETLARRYERQFEALRAGAETLRPGVRSSAVCQAMEQTLNAAGAIVSNPHGHSFGLEIREYPIVVRDNGLRIRDDCVDVPSDLELEAGMVINLEISIHMPSMGSLHIERTFMVTPQGGQSVVPQERSRPWVPG